ncbi:MAG: twitching motility protein PilT, partial [Ginsengibacter sp.]
EKIAILCQHIQIANTNRNTVLQSLENPAVNDFEDGLDYYAALQNDCVCIITEDISDFYFSTIEVVTSETFFNKYLLPKQ